MSNKSTKMIVEAGISIALSVVLSLIVLFRMPLGGSVTLASKLPLIIYSIRWQRKRGVLVGAIFGLIQILMGGYVIHPAQAVLDYIVSFAAIGLAGIRFGDGFSRKSFIPSIILAYIISGASNVLSGMIYFNDMTVATKAGFKSFFAYALAYNYSFLAADLAILLVIMLVSFNRMKELYKSQL